MKLTQLVRLNTCQIDCRGIDCFLLSFGGVCRSVIENYLGKADQWQEQHCQYWCYRGEYVEKIYLGTKVKPWFIISERTEQVEQNDTYVG